MSSRRFLTRTTEQGTFCSLWLRKSCDASIAQHWLKNYGLSVNFMFHKGWYKTSWECTTTQQRQVAEQLTSHCN